jgi:hypothetical protein
MLVIRNHSAISVTTLTTLMAALLPSPGTLNWLVFMAAGVPTAGATAAFGTADASSDMGRLPLMDDRKHLFAHADEFGFRLHLARVAAREELARERHVGADVRDAPGAGAHHDQARGQEQRLFDRVRDEDT